MADPLLKISEDIGELKGELKGIVKALVDNDRNQTERLDKVFGVLEKHQVAINEELVWRSNVSGKAKVVLIILGAAWSVCVIAITALSNKIFK